MREGLRDTPARVVRSYEEMFSGYGANPRSILNRTFGEAAGYREPVILKNIRLTSCCEHHMLPVTGKAHIGYLPNKRVVGISKLSRAVEGFARRLQIQERLVVEIAEAIQEAIDPRGVAVIVEAEHSCMTLRGVRAPGAAMICSHFTGGFRDSAGLRADFTRMVGL